MEKTRELTQNSMIKFLYCIICYGKTYQMSQRFCSTSNPPWKGEPYFNYKKFIREEKAVAAAFLDLIILLNFNTSTEWAEKIP